MISRLDVTFHANEDIAGSVERLDCCCTHCELHQPGNLADDKLHETPVVEYANDRTEIDDDGKYL